PTAESASPAPTLTDSVRRVDTVRDTVRVTDTAKAPAPGVDSSPAAPAPAPKATGGSLASGTTIELAASARICSTSNQPGDRFQATVVVPVTGSDGMTLAVGTPAVLQVTKVDAPLFIGAKADSLTIGGKSAAVKRAQVRIFQREFTAGPGATGLGVGACIPTGGRITLTLQSSVKTKS
ncbi:MAG: hypothetical protein H0W67_10580, partial [Gemmatimonadales bacterium]|nr:hypothetical protein [Gemmatimonadales bacterium]